MTRDDDDLMVFEGKCWYGSISNSARMGFAVFLKPSRNRTPVLHNLLLTFNITLALHFCDTESMVVARII